MVGENILDVFLAVPRVVGENILGGFLAVPRVVGSTFATLDNAVRIAEGGSEGGGLEGAGAPPQHSQLNRTYVAVPRVVGENILGVFLAVPRVVGENILESFFF